MKLLITGGSGFVGTHLIGELLASGHEVAIFDKNMSLHSVSVVAPDGTRADPADWRDKTPEPPRLSVGFGVGLGGSGGDRDHHPDGESDSG